MTHYKYAAVVLVYRNVHDLVECIDSMKKSISGCRIIVVNAYYDDASRDAIEKAALAHDCDFLNIENKGYSYGNNIGIDFAKRNYDFEYIIVSNPDITIDKFDDARFQKNAIYAPKIIARSGKNQNPMAVKRNRVSEYWIYRGFKTNRSFALLLGLALGKTLKWLESAFKSSPYVIYQAHGSFVILHKGIIDKLHPIYDENMFLFAEEGVLALKARLAGCPTFYTEDVVIRHKEDGSMSLAKLKVKDELAKANMYFYEHYGKR